MLKQVAFIVKSENGLTNASGQLSLVLYIISNIPVCSHVKNAVMQVLLEGCLSFDFLLFMLVLLLLLLYVSNQFDAKWFIQC